MDLVQVMSDPGVVDSRLHPCLSAGDSRWEDVLEEAVNLYFSFRSQDAGIGDEMLSLVM